MSNSSAASYFLRAADELLTKDCAKLYGVLLGQMSEASQTRVKEMPAGKRAMEECDPLGLLTCVVATHIKQQKVWRNL